MTDPSVDGYHAGMRCDHTACPYDENTDERREWQMWYDWGAGTRKAMSEFRLAERALASPLLAND